MSSLGRSAPARGRSSALIWAGVVVLGVLIALWAWTNSGTSETSTPSTYVDGAEQAQLQIDLEQLDAEDDWRERVNLPRQRDRDIPADWWPGFALGFLLEIIFWGVCALLVAGLAYVIYVIIRNGRASGVTESPTPKRNRSRHRATAMAQPDDAPLRGLNEILVMDDVEAAMGALLRLALEAAGRLTGRMPPRSETARDVLRALPMDWPYRGLIRELVQAAERSRFAGYEMSREELERLVEKARPLIAEAERRS